MQNAFVDLDLGNFDFLSAGRPEIGKVVLIQSVVLLRLMLFIRMKGF